MKEIRKTSQFKKDYKRFSKDLNKVKLLFSIVEKLAKGEDIPSEFKPHQLKGEWKDYMEYLPLLQVFPQSRIAT